MTGENEDPVSSPCDPPPPPPPPPTPPSSNTDPNCGEFPQRDPRPGGDIDESEDNLDDEDRRVAEILRDEGYQVKKRRASPPGTTEGGKTSDLFVTDPQTGVTTTVEVKQITTNNPQTIRRRVNDALRGEESFQSGTIIIDTVTAGVMTKENALEGLRLVIEEANRRLSLGLESRLRSVRIIGRDYDISTSYPDTCL